MPEPGVRVLKAVRVADQARSTRAAHDAQQEQEAQALLEAAYARGFQDGQEQERSSAAGADQRGAQAVEQLLQVARSRHAEQVDGCSGAVLRAALDVAEWVLRHETSADTRSLLTRLEQAASALMPSAQVRVLVSPSDAAAVRTWAEAQRGVEVVVEPSLPPGDAAYETADGAVDVSVTAALRIAAETLGLDAQRRSA